MKLGLRLFRLALVLPLLAACVVQPISAPAPTPDPDIYNQVPDTTVFEPGQCTAVLNAPAPAYASNSLGGQPTGEVPPGEYEVGVAADYGSSLWLMLNGVGATNFVNSADVASLSGDCATGNPLAGTSWQVTDYADPNNTTGMTTLPAGTSLTADFGYDYTLGGSAGCNSYSAAYELRGASLTIGPPAATAMACAENVMAQETVFLDNLQAVTGYKLDDVEPRLHLLNDKGQVIILLTEQ